MNIIKTITSFVEVATTQPWEITLIAQVVTVLPTALIVSISVFLREVLLAITMQLVKLMVVRKVTLATNPLWLGYIIAVVIFFLKIFLECNQDSLALY